MFLLLCVFVFDSSCLWEAGLRADQENNKTDPITWTTRTYLRWGLNSSVIVCTCTLELLCDFDVREALG